MASHDGNYQRVMEWLILRRDKFFLLEVTLVSSLKQTYLHFNPFLIIYCQQVRCLFRITLSRISFIKIIDTIGHFFLSMSLILSDPFALEVE